MQRSVTAADKAVKLAITQYQGGLVDFNRVALLEQDLVQQQNLLAEAQGDIDTGLVHLYRSLGGGWESCCPGADGGVEPPTAEGSAAASNEEIPAGKNANEQPGTGVKPGQDNTTPSAPNYQQSPNAPRRPLPGPADKSPAPPVPGAKINGPQIRSVVKTLPSDNKAMQLRHSNDDSDWTQDDGPPALRLSRPSLSKGVPSNVALSNLTLPKSEQRKDVPAEIAATSDSIVADGANDAVPAAAENAGPILHAGLIQGDSRTMRLLR